MQTFCSETHVSRFEALFGALRAASKGAITFNTPKTALNVDQKQRKASGVSELWSSSWNRSPRRASNRVHLAARMVMRDFRNVWRLSDPISRVLAVSW